MRKLLLLTLLSFALPVLAEGAPPFLRAAPQIRDVDAVKNADEATTLAATLARWTLLERSRDEKERDPRALEDTEEFRKTLVARFPAAKPPAVRSEELKKLTEKDLAKEADKTQKALEIAWKAMSVENKTDGDGERKKLVQTVRDLQKRLRSVSDEAWHRLAPTPEKKP